MMKKLPWHLQDYLFAVLMSLGMLVSGLLIPLIAPRFLELIIWAPFGGIFLTLGMARLQNQGSVAVMILPLAIVLTLLSPLIGGYLALTAILTEASLLFLRGNYRLQKNRYLGNIIFFLLALVIGYGTAALVVGEEFAALLTQPWHVAGLILAMAMTASVGWRLGEIMLSQLKRMGRWKTET